MRRATGRIFFFSSSCQTMTTSLADWLLNYTGCPPVGGGSGNAHRPGNSLLPVETGFLRKGLVVAVCELLARQGAAGIGL